MPISGDNVLLYEKKDKIVTLTLNREERMNAISYDLLEKLNQALERFRDDEDAWVLIVTGAGDKAFCAGDDLIEMKDELGTEKRAQRSRNFEKLFGYRIWKPMIAAINGYAMAGGFYLAQMCDIRIASEKAKLGIPEARWNLGAYWVSDLTRQMHMGHVLEMTLWGDGQIGAQRGYEMGWINRVVPQEKVMEEANAWAERIIYLGPRAVRNFKEMIYRGCYMPPEESYAFGRALEAGAKNMKDTIEGTKAFAEKRKPVFRNE